MAKLVKKYVVVKSEDNVEKLFTFPSGVAHCDFLLDLKRETTCELVSAGFVYYTTGEDPVCLGKSFSLKSASRPEDTVLLLSQMEEPKNLK